MNENGAITVIAEMNGSGVVTENLRKHDGAWILSEHADPVITETLQFTCLHYHQSTGHIRRLRLMPTTKYVAYMESKHVGKSIQIKSPLLLLIDGGLVMGLYPTSHGWVCHAQIQKHVRKGALVWLN